MYRIGGVARDPTDKMTPILAEAVNRFEEGVEFVGRKITPVAVKPLLNKTLSTMVRRENAECGTLLARRFFPVTGSCQAV